MNLEAHIKAVQDFPKPGILFRDITPLLRDAAALKATVDQMAERTTRWDRVDAIAGIESRGFVFATALALRLDKGLIPIRKPGKLPRATFREEYSLEYGTDSLEMHQDAAHHGERILLVDDLLATGGTMGAACQLVRRSGAQIVGCLFVIELAFLEGRSRLPEVAVESLVTY